MEKGTDGRKMGALKFGHSRIKLGLKRVSMYCNQIRLILNSITNMNKTQRLRREK